ncbi:MAG: OstA-like protein [Alphaproteobacteria bacterium]|nr:OstA-like protein [Alphaproteobacteria bacterium]
MILLPTSKRLGIILLFLLFLNNLCVSQEPVSESIIDIIKSDFYQQKKVDSAHNYIILNGHVVLKDKLTYIYTDSAVINTISNIVECFGHIVIKDGDSIEIKSNYLLYNGKTKDAKLRIKVILTDKISKLTTDSFNYNIKTKQGYYFKKGMLQKKDNRIKSENADYNGITKHILFTQDVVAFNKENKIIADEIWFDQTQDYVQLYKPAVVYLKNKIIITDSAWYNFKAQKGELFNRSIIVDSNYRLIADYMNINDSTTHNYYFGSVFIKTREANSKELHAEHVYSVQNKDYFKAYENLWVKLIENKDTFYLKADTLIGGTIPDLKLDSFVVNRRQDSIPVILDTVKNHILLAYNNVKVFHDSMQATCDSFVYTQHDSVGSMFGSPVIWLNQTQIVGDSIFIWINNRKIEKLHILEHGFIINKLDSSKYYNQLKGNIMDFNFDTNNHLKNGYVTTNSETIYFIQDAFKKFIGLNKASSKNLYLDFENNKPILIKYFIDVEGITYPMFLLPEELQLRGFNWLDSWRPKKWYEIFY